MKKALSVLCAVALAFSLSMPAFAAATPGQEDNTFNLHKQIASALQDGLIEEAENACSELVSIINETNAPVSNTTAWLANNVLDRTAGKTEAASVGSNVPSGVSATTSTSADASSVALNTVEVTANSASDVTIKLDASMSTQSALGVRMTLSLPASLFNGVNLQQNMLHLLYQADNGEVQTLFTLLTMEQTADTVTLTFWVPHFSTYYITTSTTIPGGNGGNNGGDNGGNNGSDNNNNSGNSGSSSNSSTSTAPSTSTTANPIKATGADMSAVVVFLAVAAVAALAGGMIVVKKNGLNI